jgi:hypothetical protein
MEYTKGEWVINTVSGIRIESKTKCICLLGDIEDEDFANVQLISAAPDMYEALKETQPYISSTGHPGLLKLINEALLKAEGKDASN